MSTLLPVRLNRLISMTELESDFVQCPVAERARSHPDRLALVTPTRSFSYAELDRSIANVVAGLRTHLVDHVLIFQYLCILEAFLTGLKECRGIRHRVIQPATVKRIPNIVVM